MKECKHKFELITKPIKGSYLTYPPRRYTTKHKCVYCGEKKTTTGVVFWCEAE